MLDAEAGGLSECGADSRAQTQPSALSRAQKKPPHPGDREIPPSGEVNSLVMEVTFSKSKFVTFGLSGRPEHSG